MNALILHDGKRQIICEDADDSVVVGVWDDQSYSGAYLVLTTDQARSLIDWLSNVVDS